MKTYKQFVNEQKKSEDYGLDSKAAVRNRGDVVFPAESDQVVDGADHYHINTKSQSINALSRSHQYDTVPEWYNGTLKELQEAVVKKVHAKYPEIEIAALKDKK
jgi:hypothetical protein